MAKFKPLGSKKPKATATNQGFIPCLVILFLGFALVSVLLYLVLKS